LSIYDSFKEKMMSKRKEGEGINLLSGYDKEKVAK